MQLQSRWLLSTLLLTPYFPSGHDFTLKSVYFYGQRKLTTSPQVACEILSCISINQLITIFTIHFSFENNLYICKLYMYFIKISNVEKLNLSISSNV